MFKRTKFACYSTNICMSIVANLSPLLFITFKNLYDISYSLLGLLVLINFFTQLTMDLVLSFFPQKFNIPLTVKLIPVITLLGLVVFALSPFIFGGAVFVGLLIGTIIFSMSGGLAEVLISPVIAAIPSKNPERDMSKLHSIYAFGVVGVVLLGTLFLLIFDDKYWPILVLLFTLAPLFSIILFAKAKIPNMQLPATSANGSSFFKNKLLWLCVFAIFLGGASECTMAQWSSGYLENALKIPKALGDIFGVAMFALVLGLGRWIYGKVGRNVEKILLLGAICASVCYLVAALCPIPIIALIASALTGFATSMLWPGSLIVAAEKFPLGGVTIYALMASGGDLGASVVPQILGIVTDAVSGSELALDLSSKFNLTTDQIGMKAGMLVASIFPIIAIFVFSYIYKIRKREEK